jgi:hypothetical protein
MVADSFYLLIVSQVYQRLRTFLGQTVLPIHSRNTNLSWSNNNLGTRKHVNALKGWDTILEWAKNAIVRTAWIRIGSAIYS